MNIYAWIILLTLVISEVLEFAADYLNLKSLKPELPKEFEDVYDADRYKKSQEYTKVRTRFSWIASVFNLLLFLLVWFSGGFEILDQWIRSLGYQVIINGLIFFGVLAGLKTLLGLPFSIYSTFVIENEFGFNRTSWKTFATDGLKGFGLSIILGVPILSGILAFFEFGGDLAWLYAWLLISGFSLAIQYVAPTWIMPLFNTFTPLEEGSLRDKIFEVAGKAEFPLTNVFVIDGSKRSSKSNAFFTGFGKNKRIALYDTLVDQHSEEELVAVIAHEIGHYKKKHILKGTIFSIFYTGVIFFLLSLFLTFKPLFEAFYVSEPSVYAGLLFFSMLYSPVEVILSMFLQAQSRKHEFEADAFARELMGTFKYLVSALKKLSSHNLSNITPHPFYVFLNYSHPPLKTRIEALKGDA